MSGAAKIAALTAVAAIGAATAAVGVEASGLGERIPVGVTVDGVDVGGLSPEEAARRLEEHAAERAGQPVEASGPLRTIVTSGAELGADARIEEALTPASAGRIGPVRRWFGSRKSRDVPLRFELPASRVQALAGRLGATAAVDASLDVDGTGIHVRPGSDGRSVDIAALRAGLETLPGRIRVTTVAVPPRITTAEAEAAATHARTLVDRPRTLVVGSETFVLSPEQLREALTVRRAEQGFAVGFDPGRLERRLPAPTSPQDAAFRVEGERVRIVGGTPGRTVDARATALALAASADATVRVPVALRQPEITVAELEALGIRERVSAFTTHYPPGQPRVVNIQRASAVIDGTILRPGERFSMNAVLGERTIAKGYVPAPQIVGSSFADSVGGGISQVATMLYNGAFFAGLEVIEHQPHTLYIDRYPLGREATISWGGPELIFHNDWPAAVLIDLEASESSITVQFFSSLLGRRVETETLPPYGHGGGGFDVEYTRRVYRGSELVRDERYRVRYGVATKTRVAGGQ